jgi:phenylalanyl-tRNA synthetase beta chain
MVLSGQDEGESVLNCGKPKKVDFGSFVKRLQLVLGDFKMVACTYHNELIHPYQSANILCRDKLCGFVTKLHPKIQEEYGIGDTFLAELEFDLLAPEHINATSISKYQGVYKDLSVVVDKTRRYREIDNALGELKLELLKRWYPIDVYEDEQLGDKKSLTVRFFIQSHEKTLQDSDIEEVMAQVMEQLLERCDARLR